MLVPLQKEELLRRGMEFHWRMQLGLSRAACMGYCMHFHQEYGMLTRPRASWINCVVTCEMPFLGWQGEYTEEEEE